MTEVLAASDEGAQNAGLAVSRTIAAPLLHVWDVLVSRAGTQAWLGEGAQLGTKGESWRADDGTFGVVRTLHRLRQVRVSWHADDGAPYSIIDLQLAQDGEGTRLDLTEEPVHGDPAVSEQRWGTALDRLAAAALG